MILVFDMTDLGLMTYFISMEIKQDEGEVFTSQIKYAKEILEKFCTGDCKAMATPMS